MRDLCKDVYSLTEVSDLIGFSLRFKEGGYTETETKREAFAAASASRIVIVILQNI